MLNIINRFTRISIALVLIHLLQSCHSLEGNSKTGTAGKDVDKWYDDRTWLNGLQRTPHESIDREEFAREYQAHKMWWDTAFAFLKEEDLAALSPGDHPIVGNDVFARVTEGRLKQLDSSKWEAHKNYIDVHYVISGREKIGMGPLSSATMVVPYNDKRDISFYEGQGVYFVADTTNFFIFFPKQIHRPGLEVNGQGTDKKIVIKIKSADAK